MEQGITSKVIGRTLEYTFEGIQRAAPHVIKAYEVVTHKIVFPVGTVVLSGAVTVAASIIAPKRKR